MADEHKVQYFLGANAPGGFYSLYDQLIVPETARAIYILKGGPGCGKSTLMRAVAEQVCAAGYQAEYILCSGDPDSLDAVVFPQLSVALVDGTAPHVVEPKYPGVVERYVNLGDCYDKPALGDLRQEIMGCMKGYKGCYQRAYRCLDAAAEITQDTRATLLTPEVAQQLEKRARGILSRELKAHKSSRSGGVQQRFLGAITHRGILCQYDTVLAQCQRVYELTDRYGFAHELLAYLLAGAVNGGYQVVACPDPMAPERLSHLLIPQRSLAFVTSDAVCRFPEEPYRRIRLDAMADEELLHRSRARLRFAQKVSAALTQEAIDSLSQAKAMHDQLEGLYNPHVNFDRVNRMAQDVAREILEE